MNGLYTFVSKHWWITLTELLAFAFLRERLFVCVRVHVRDRVCVCVCVCFGRGINEDEDRRHCLLCLCMRVGRCVWGVSALHESLKRDWGPQRHTWRLRAKQCVPSKQRTALFAENTLCMCLCCWGCCQNEVLKIICSGVCISCYAWCKLPSLHLILKTKWLGKYNLSEHL